MQVKAVSPFWGTDMNRVHIKQPNLKSRRLLKRRAEIERLTSYMYIVHSSVVVVVNLNQNGGRH